MQLPGIMKCISTSSQRLVTVYSILLIVSFIFPPIKSPKYHTFIHSYQDYINVVENKIMTRKLCCFWTTSKIQQTSSIQYFWLNIAEIIGWTLYLFMCRRKISQLLYLLNKKFSPRPYFARKQSFLLHVCAKSSKKYRYTALAFSQSRRVATKGGIPG